MRSGRAAAVGPVTAAPLVDAGIVPIQPERFRMGALIRLVCEHLESTGSSASTPGTARSRCAARWSTSTTGASRSRPSRSAILRALVKARGSVVGRDRLAAGLPGTNDEHALEVALSRLRQTLGVPGADRHGRQAGVPDRCVTTTSHGRPSRVSRWRRRVYDQTDPRKHGANSVGHTSSTT